MTRHVPALLLVAAAAACGAEAPETGPDRDQRAFEERAARTLAAAVLEVDAAADSVDRILRPVAFLTPAQESRLRRYLNEEHLARARALGARPADSSGIAALASEGRLVELEDTTSYWVVRELDHSRPWVTPDTRALLEEIGERFHARLADMGLPAFRYEISSVLRTPDQQADLRRGNANATRSTSAHEFGTTVDIPYSAYAAPVTPIAEPDLGGAEWLRPTVDHVARGSAELVANRRSRELMAVLGEVLTELQSEGRVYVTLERGQPVFHITLASRATQ